MKRLIKNDRTLNVALFAIVSFLLFVIDWLLKYFLFDVTASPNDLTVFGIRSLPHDNTTVFSYLNFSPPLGVTYGINFALLFIFVIAVLFVKSKAIAIGLGVIVAGVLGNTLDIVTTTSSLTFANKEYTHYVRDIIYLPWWDRGTFNIADVCIWAGVIFVILSISASIYDDVSTKNKAKKLAMRTSK